MSPPSIFFPPAGDKTTVEAGAVFTPRFDANGLIPAIVTDAGDGTVLMFAWMNAAALEQTLRTRVVYFWSRSRQQLWLKGEQSGNILRVEDVRVDCDQDVLQVIVRLEADGAACHTGARSCFYRSVAPVAEADGTMRLQRHSKHAL